MVDDRITDGKRIAELLASELDGREGPFAGVSVTDARPDVEPTADGARAYAVVSGGENRGEDESVGEGEYTLATAFVHPDRVRLEFPTAPDRTFEAAREADLRARPKAVDPPRTLVFVESGAAVKRAADVVAAVAGEDG